MTCLTGVPSRTSGSTAQRPGSLSGPGTVPSRSPWAPIPTRSPPRTASPSPRPAPPDPRDPAPAVAAGNQPLERQGGRPHPAEQPVQPAVREGLLRAERVHPVLGDAGDGLQRGTDFAHRAVGAVGDP